MRAQAGAAWVPAVLAVPCADTLRLHNPRLIYERPCTDPLQMADVAIL